MMQAAELLRRGDLDGCLAALQSEVRAAPADPKLRVFLFQVLCILGQWPRAMTQLNVAAELDAKNLLMAQVCRPALNCEALRAEVFAGRRLPLVLGEPDEWVGWLLQAAQLTGAGRQPEAAPLRERAFEAAPTIAGRIESEGNGGGSHSFEWIADADPRLGPMLEVIVDGRYYWVPLANIRELTIEPPADLRDVVWLPANITWSNGGEAVALLPARYPGSERGPDAGIRLARGTDWSEPSPGLFTGLGQRILATDAGEHPLLQVRRLTLDQPPPAPAAEGSSASRESSNG